MSWDRRVTEFEQLLLDKIRSIESGLAELSKDVINVRVAVAKLTVKSGIWGALAGLIPVSLFIVWKSLS